MKNQRAEKSPAEIYWNIKSYEKLSRDELYHIIRARLDVFVVEQCCYYQDLDGKDMDSHHLCGFDGQNLAAYARLLPPGLAYPDAASIGRVLTTGPYRRRGLGRELMRTALSHCDSLWPGSRLKIGAQAYLKGFYEDFGFSRCGDDYLEDGILHLPMLRPPG